MIARSIHFLWKATILPVKLLFDTGELTFRAGVKVGSLPVRGSRFAVRALGWKLAVAVVIGAVAGFLLGREVERRLHAMHHHDDDLGLDRSDDGRHGVIGGAA